MYDVKFSPDGFPVQLDGDSGDAMARTGEYWNGLKFYNVLGIPINEWPKNTQFDFLKARCSLYVDKIPYRSPYPPYNNPKDVSRDQLMPFYISSNLWYLPVPSRFMCPNGDILGPIEYAAISRSNRHYPIYLWVADICLCISVLIRCWQARDPNNVGDDILLTQYCILSALINDTIFAKAARWLYKTLRPKGVQYAFDWYHRPESGGNPFNELYRPLISKFLS